MLEDLYVLRDRARQAQARGDLDGAIRALVAAAEQTHVAESDYASLLRPLAEALETRGDARGALSVVAYLATSDPAAWKLGHRLLPLVPPVDRARALAAQGRTAEAAREMEDAGLVAAAAILREKAKDWAAARALWARLAGVTERGSDAYVAALVRFDLARCAKQCGDDKQAREAIVASVRLLEEAADHFESVGQRERAFDCFGVLAQVGRESGAFEDVLEGYVNCIRILREDHLKYFALEHYEEAIAAAIDRGETSAAATLAREAADYARSIGMPAAANAYVVRQAELWRALARRHQERGASPAMAENALLASVLAAGAVGQWAQVGALYQELSLLDISLARREHYARAAARYEPVPSEPLETSRATSAPAKADSSFTAVWHVDVVEWEQRGSAAEACAEVLLDKRWPDRLRRQALVTRLAALPLEGPDADGGPRTKLQGPHERTNARVRLAEHLAQLQLYGALSPLEALFGRGERHVKIAVLQALQTLFFKRSFVTVRAALRDEDAVVADQAAKSVEALYFPHAVDPLARILRESPEPAARTASLRALARIDTLEAAELLLGVLEHGAPVDRSAAVAALKGARGGKFVDLARQALRTAPEPLRVTLHEVLGARGLSA